MSSRVVHVNDHVEGAVYIGRHSPRKGLAASPWANPYPIGGIQGWDRITVVELYESDLCEPELEGRRVAASLADLPALRGKLLACWCRHDGEERTARTLCHGDVLIDLLERHTDEQLIAGDVTWGLTQTWMPPEDQWCDPALQKAP